MSRPARQQLTLRDVMPLIGSAAIGLAGYRFATRGLFRGWFQLTDGGIWGRSQISAFWLVGYCVQLVSLLIPFAAAWTLVLPMLRVRPPRKSWRRVWAQPGMAACLAAGFGWLWSASGLALARLSGVAAPTIHIHAQNNERWMQHYFADEVFMYVGLSVSAIWAFLLCTGRWRRPLDSIDRLGRIVGVMWILIGLAWTIREYMDLL
jgi:hypothetical protein